MLLVDVSCSEARWRARWRIVSWRPGQGSAEEVWEGAMTMWNIVVVHERGHVLFLLLPPLGVDGLGDAGAPSVAPGALGSGAGRPVLGVILGLIQAIIGDVDDGQ